MDKSVESTSDARVANNGMRHQYRVLSEVEKTRMVQIKDMGAAFVALLHEVGGTDPAMSRLSGREFSIAQTKIEEAVMWAVRGVTG